MNARKLIGSKLVPIIPGESQFRWHVQARRRELNRTYNDIIDNAKLIGMEEYKPKGVADQLEKYRKLGATKYRRDIALREIYRRLAWKLLWLGVAIVFIYYLTHPNL